MHEYLSRSTVSKVTTIYIALRTVGVISRPGSTFSLLLPSPGSAGGDEFLGLQVVDVDAGVGPRGGKPSEGEAEG